MTTQTATIPTSPQLKRRSHWKRNTGIGGGAFLILLIGIGACNPTPPSGTATGSATAPTVAAGPQVAISSWYTGGGQTHLNAITDDLGAANTAAAGGNVPALNTACTSLQGDIEAAQPYPAVPDPQAQADWSTGLAQYARAATDCVAGISTLAPNLINQGVQEMNAGSVAIQAATTRIQALRWHPKPRWIQLVDGGDDPFAGLLAPGGVTRVAVNV